MALPSGREILWEYAHNPNVPESGCVARVRPCDYVEADVSDEVAQLFGGDPSVITWRAPTSWEWPSPLGYGARHRRRDLDDAVVSLSLADYRAVHHLVTRELAIQTSRVGQRSTLVPDATFQLALAWSDEHLNRFVIHGREYGVWHAGGIGFRDDPRHVRLANLGLRVRERLLYGV